MSEAPLPDCPDATDEEVAQLARDLHHGRVFSTLHMDASDARLLGMVFMPLGLDGCPFRPESIGMAWEYLDRAGPRSINGLPCFFSVRYFPASRMEQLFTIGRRLLDAERAALDPTPTNGDTA